MSLTLDHEVFDDSVEAAALETKTLLTGAQSTEVLRAQHDTFRDTPGTVADAAPCGI